MKLTFICCSLVLFAACTKNKEADRQPGSTVRQMLLAGKWQPSGLTGTASYMGKDSTLDLFYTVATCDRDDFIIFAENGTASQDEGADKCPNDSQVEVATWLLLAGDTKLLIIDNNPDTMHLEISATEMKLGLTKANSQGTPVYFVHTYRNLN